MLLSLSGPVDFACFAQSSQQLLRYRELSGVIRGKLRAFAEFLLRERKISRGKWIDRKRITFESLRKREEKMIQTERER